MINCLIEYKGGGYDGCFWEWNYCYYDKEGKFHDIYSSGAFSCKTEKEIQDYIKSERNVEYEDYFIYGLNIPEAVEDFTQNSNPGNVLAVAKWLAENQDIYLEGKCSCCGQLRILYECYPEGFRGAGGIAIEATELICEDCYSTYSCSYCGEYCGSEEEFNEQGYCEYCSSKEDI